MPTRRTNKEGDRLVSEPVTSVLYDLLREAFATQRVEVSEHTEYYLINLLGTFARVEPRQLSRALGPQLLNASLLEPAERYLKLKEVADTTLFLAGLFLDYVEAQLAATDYYFEIGSSAYLHLGRLGRQHAPSAEVFADTYNDLGHRFEDFVRVLSSISDAELFASNERKLGLYERWQRAGTARDMQRLISLGIIPTTGDDSVKH